MVSRPLLAPVEWIGSAREDLRAFPEAVQDEVGYALYLAQRGEHPPQAKRRRRSASGVTSAA